MNRRHRMALDTVVWVGASIFLVFGLARGAEATPATPAGTYAEECGNCHVAYPAKMMAPGEWSQVLGRLDRHYGVDASLDAATLAAVATQLQASVATTSAAIALPRITTSRWFRGEHDEIGAAAWRSPAVKSAANCAACHPGATRGVFSEHDMKLPGGLQSNHGNEGEHEHEHDD